MPHPSINPCYPSSSSHTPSSKRPREDEKDVATEVAHQQLKKQRTEHEADHPTPESFLPLNEECTLRILTLLDAQDLCRIAQVSRRASELAKQVIDARQKAVKSSPPYSHPLNNDCLFHFLTFLDIPDLCRFAQVNRQMNELAKEAMRVVGKEMLGNRFFLQHNNSLSTVQYELSMTRGELESLDKTNLTQYKVDSEQIKKLIVKDKYGAWQIRESICNLSLLPLEKILQILASQNFCKIYRRTINALAISCLNQNNKNLPRKKLDIRFQLAVKNAIAYSQPNVLRFLFLIGPVDRVRQGRSNILHLLAREQDPSLLNAALEETHQQKKWQELMKEEDRNGDTPLLLSVHNEQAFRYLIKAGANPLHHNHSGQTLIHLATKHGNYSYLKLVLEELIALGFKKEDLLEDKDHNGLAPLFYITEFQVPDAKEKLRLLLSMEANVRYKGMTILHMATGHQSVSIDFFRFIIQQSPDLLHEEDDHGQAPVFYAIRDPEKLKILVQQGADIHVQDESGHTLLYYALYDNSLVENLLANGLDINFPDYIGWTPLFHSLLHSHENFIEVFDLLIAKGADQFHKDLEGRSLLHVAISTSVSTFKQNKVFELGLDLEEQDNEGETPLFEAVLRSSEMLAPLLERGANVHHQNHKGQTPLHLAVDRYISNEDINQLLKAGADLETEDNNGETPIFYAVKKLRDRDQWESENEDLEILQTLELLLDRGANVYHHTKEGKTIFDLAKEIKDQRLDELLAKYQSRISS
ncbi:MAG: ankyrin repeat domain-containing protein [Parachlamydiaceae bacterium]